MPSSGSPETLKAAAYGLRPIFTKGVAFNPTKDIPSLSGKVILVTGGANGLGRAAVKELARHGPPAQIWIADLKQGPVDAVIAEIKSEVPAAVVRFLELDLGSFNAVKKATVALVAQTDRLDLVMLNAGVLTDKLHTTAEGYELQFGINFVGHALLTRLLMPLLLRTAAVEGSDVRVVGVASAGHALHPKPGGILFKGLKDPSGGGLSAFARYGQSKLAVMLWARRLAAENPTLTVATIHPGNVSTRLAAELLKAKPDLASTAPSALDKVMGRLLRVKLPEVGCWNQLWAATAKKGDVVSGKYYCPVGIPDREFGIAANKGEADALGVKLWEWLEGELRGQKLEG